MTHENGNSRPQFGVHLSVFGPRELVDLGILADQCGFDSVWIPDHLADLPPVGDRVDPWVLFGAIAANSHNVRMLPGVTDPIRIHPAKLANIVATLDELSYGRADLAIGAGEIMNVVDYGMQWREHPKIRLSQLKEAIIVIRGLLRSNLQHPFSFDGEFFRLKNARLDQHPSRDPKIIVGALGGKRALELVGEVGDGWYPALNTLELFRQRCATIDASARANGRDPTKIEKIHFTYGIMSEDKAVIKKCLDSIKLSILTLSSKIILKEMAQRGLVDSVYTDSTISYQQMRASEDEVRKAISIAQKIPDDIVSSFAVIGTPSQIREKLEPFVKAGASHIVFFDVYSMGVSGKVEDYASFIREFSRQF